ncbi:hypothetical protein SERLA73DRAFT_188954 [Serpula lacrymans var. lacrymans S7.3]|uniref:Uncharacterized protein n=2 Tax=Serpula lacrymans var. lacrymans TaxID=341189 RepID=F8QCH5_SERL3|nr:uncharacterized protein SERLADRAFT_479574 [Serpula lacrymans var. lacrymans S7.9]EGN93840.1 hypothetical protein SERLA73DRAFT_188954 [Serpula lacrymans var. lacrymans S7.3]EGO19209.1 hypothetical protein SERLADRAFT_479574 [Serpula lacrymans var. lacrymans S7.9]
MHIHCHWHHPSRCGILTIFLIGQILIRQLIGLLARYRNPLVPSWHYHSFSSQITALLPVLILITKPRPSYKFT